MAQNNLQVKLEEKVIALEEVVVRPHNLTGHITTDLRSFNTKPVITSASLGLPKAELKVKTRNERLLFEVDNGKLIRFRKRAISVNSIKLISKISGRTKMLKNRIELDKRLETENKIYNLYSEKTLSEELKIPLEHVPRFVNFLINQANFLKLVENMNDLQLLDYLKNQGKIYKKANQLQ
ncbi:hypothetical protein NBT05_17490 [Aquimarina sp. ERC-38]|uniref:hypothetical protein n=1 Tax=Aquimarina sp. ERC-38 TaxID=2949996 RepID=UPI002245BEA0|nr:hypothetical protein [Aquimarina sp. ERC-38]UZO80723.1 hypothetical protein NBT05_17490 [Aquimarina sp. ERC-38]